MCVRVCVFACGIRTFMATKTVMNNEVSSVSNYQGTLAERPLRQQPTLDHHPTQKNLGRKNEEDERIVKPRTKTHTHILKFMDGMLTKSRSARIPLIS